MELKINELSEMKLNYAAGVYIIYNKITSDCYVGSTICFNERLTKHLSSLNTGKVSEKLGGAIKEYGIENFKFLVIEEIEDVSLLEKKENYWITKLSPKYNHQKRIKRYELTKERNEKISKTLQSVIKRGNNNPMFGIKRPKEVVERIFKTRSSNKEALYCSNSKRVIMLDLDGNFMAEFRSTNIASKVLKIARDKIAKICEGTWPYSSKDEFTFKYKK